MFGNLQQVNLAKATLRNEIKLRLKTLSKESVCLQSQDVMKQLLESKHYKESSRIGIYLSLPEEIQTDSIIKDIFATGKQCFIPRYTKTDMAMVKLKSLEDLDSLPVTSWKIKQPLETEEREDAYTNGGLDLIIVPGLAFTRNGDRLGRGKGYYDRYLQKLKQFKIKELTQPLITIGLAFKEQIVEEIPTSENDFRLNSVMFPK